MMGRTRIISGLLGVLVLAGMGYADLPPLAQPDSRGLVDRAPTSPSHEFELTLAANLAASHWLHGGPLPSLAFDGPPVEEANSPHVLADRPNALHLCLCALLSLGLCKSAPWVKRLPLGVIPSWYHEGGPLQIGHSLALSPDCVCLASLCFAQPEGKTEDLEPVYPLGAVIALWRESQIAPAVRAPRGPPPTFPSR
jgi:hypothetical protein